MPTVSLSSQSLASFPRKQSPHPHSTNHATTAQGSAAPAKQQQPSSPPGAPPDGRFPDEDASGGSASARYIDRARDFETRRMSAAGVAYAGVVAAWCAGSLFAAVRFHSRRK